MSQYTVQLWAMVIVALQGVVILALLWFVRNFGVYTRIVADTHAENMRVHQQNLLIQIDHQQLIDKLTHHQERSA